MNFMIMMVISISCENELFAKVSVNASYTTRATVRALQAS